MPAHGSGPGFYLRVLQEGEIGADDLIEKIADGPERMIVTEIDLLLYTADHPIDALRRAVRIPALSPGWQGSMNSLLDAALAGRRAGNAGLSAVPAAAPSWNGMRRLQIVASKSESQDIRSFDLAAGDGSGLPDALPGQHLVVRLQPRADSASVLRNYSLCGAPGQGIYRIAVKRERDGIASSYLHERAEVGDMLEVSAPRGSFVLEPEVSPVVLMSAGVGITPLLVAEKSSPREVWWVHSARDGAHHPFANEVRGLIAGLSKGRSIVFYTSPSAEDRPVSHYDAVGRVDIALLQKSGMPLSSTFYLCGPTGFMGAVTSGLREQGVPAARIRTELLVQLRRLPTGRHGRSHTGRAANRVQVQSSLSSAAALPCLGMDVSAACSSLRKPAMSLCDGPAAPASVTIANAASSTANSSTRPIRSIRRARASLSFVARLRGQAWIWIFRRDNAGGRSSSRRARRHAVSRARNRWSSQLR